MSLYIGATPPMRICQTNVYWFLMTHKISFVRLQAIQHHLLWTVCQLWNCLFLFWRRFCPLHYYHKFYSQIQSPSNSGMYKKYQHCNYHHISQRTEFQCKATASTIISSRSCCAVYQFIFIIFFLLSRHQLIALVLLVSPVGGHWVKVVADWILLVIFKCAF